MASQDSESRHSNISVDPLMDSARPLSGTVASFKHQYSVQLSLESKSESALANASPAVKRHSIGSYQLTQQTANQHLEGPYLSHPLLNTESGATALISLEQHQSAVKRLVSQTEDLKFVRKIAEQERDLLKVEKDQLHSDKTRVRDQATQALETARDMSMELKDKDETLKAMFDDKREDTRRYSELCRGYELLLQENTELKDQLKYNKICSTCDELRRQVDDERKEKERIQWEKQNIKTVVATLQDQVESLKKQLDEQTKAKKK